MEGTWLRCGSFSYKKAGCLSLHQMLTVPNFARNAYRPYALTVTKSILSNQFDHLSLDGDPQTLMMLATMSSMLFAFSLLASIATPVARARPSSVTPNNQFFADCIHAINSLPEDIEGHGSGYPAIFHNTGQSVYHLPNQGCFRSCIAYINFLDKTPGREQSEMSSWEDIKDELRDMNKYCLQHRETYTQKLFGSRNRIKLVLLEAPYIDDQRLSLCFSSAGSNQTANSATK